MVADVFTDEGDEVTFGAPSVLVVVGGFLAHHEASAVVARVEPFGRRGGRPAGAVKSHARTHFDEGTALRKFCRFLVLDPDQGESLIVLEDADGTDRDSVASFGLADGPPVSGREYYKADHEHRGQDDGSKNDEGFFQRCFCEDRLQRDTFVEKGVPVNRLADFVQPEVSPRAMVMSPCRPGGD